MHCCVWACIKFCAHVCYGVNLYTCICFICRHNLASGTSERIQLSAMVAAFQCARDLIAQAASWSRLAQKVAGYNTSWYFKSQETELDQCIVWRLLCSSNVASCVIIMKVISFCVCWKYVCMEAVKRTDLCWRKCCEERLHARMRDCVCVCVCVCVELDSCLCKCPFQFSVLLDLHVKLPCH
jgi:hypothetical protein